MLAVPGFHGGACVVSVSGWALGTKKFMFYFLKDLL